MTIIDINPHRCRMGYLRDPQPDDPWFATPEDALKAATAIDDDTALLAVWDEQDTIVCIVYEGMAYWP